MPTPLLLFGSKYSMPPFGATVAMRPLGFSPLCDRNASGYRSTLSTPCIGPQPGSPGPSERYPLDIPRAGRARTAQPQPAQPAQAGSGTGHRPSRTGPRSSRVPRSPARLRPACSKNALRPCLHAKYSFDWVFCCEALHHNNHQGMTHALRETHRVLRPGGSLLVMNEPLRWPTNLKHDHAAEVAQFADNEHVYFFPEYL